MSEKPKSALDNLLKQSFTDVEVAIDEWAYSCNFCGAVDKDREKVGHFKGCPLPDLIVEVTKGFCAK